MESRPRKVLSQHSGSEYDPDVFQTCCLNVRDFLAAAGSFCFRRKAQKGLSQISVPALSLFFQIKTAPL